MSRAPANIHVRLIRESDSFESLTALLHRAYAALADMGFRYRASYQDVATTRERAGKGECYLAFHGDRIVGTVLLVPPSAHAPHCAWYDRDGVAVVSQFAVEPEFQRQELGGKLLSMAEERAAALGATEVAIDTAEGAAHLIAFYSARGYRHVGYEQWDHANYRSVILSKRLDGTSEAVQKHQNRG
jgi:GNAT superfamily N-acetyltransferase